MCDFMIGVLSTVLTAYLVALLTIKKNQSYADLLMHSGRCVPAEPDTGRDLSTMSSRGGKKKSTKTSRSTKAGVIFPVGRMLRYIKRGLPKYRIGVGAPVYLAAVLEYLTGESYDDFYRRD